MGFAVEWAGAVAQALATALQHHIDWKDRGTANAVFVPQATIARIEVKGIEGMLMPQRRDAVTLDLVTPLPAARSGNSGCP